MDTFRWTAVEVGAHDISVDADKLYPKYAHPDISVNKLSA